MSNKKDLKGYVRYDGSGRIVSGSLILRKQKPKVGKWIEIPAYECCNSSTTTTTTTTAAIPSNCVEFVVDTTEGTNFVVRLNAELDVVVNYTINWGDGTTDEDSYTSDDEEYTITSVFHEFPEENSTYTVRLCFDNPSAVTQFGIDIND
jgi:hypothetical protein